MAFTFRSLIYHPAHRSFSVCELKDGTSSTRDFLPPPPAASHRPHLLSHSPLRVECGRSSLQAGSRPLFAGDCIEADDGSRYLGFTTLFKSKERLMVHEDGATYYGPDAVPVSD